MALVTFAGQPRVACPLTHDLVANAERLFVFDASWKPAGTITHPLLGGVHDVLAEEDGIWAACTCADLLLRVSWDGRLLTAWDWRHV